MPRGRRMMVEQISSGRPIAHVAAEIGVVRKTADKWLELPRDLGHRPPKQSFGPASTESNGRSCLVEFSRQGSLMHAELARHGRE